MNAERLAAVSGWAETGNLQVHVDRVLGLEQAREAQRISEGGHVRGKLALSIGHG
jgi:NADPH:quinone reductase-like Zn-dependent oxidoreductase